MLWLTALPRPPSSLPGGRSGGRADCEIRGAKRATGPGAPIRPLTRFPPQIWDTAGQERYASLAPLYYRGAAAAAVVYDVTNMESFQKAGAWVRELQKHAQPGCVIALVGNKVDLEGGREVPSAAAAAYAAEQGLAARETSAKTGVGVQEARGGLVSFVDRL